MRGKLPHFLEKHIEKIIMKTISIASNEDSVFIRLDKTLLDEKRIIQFLDLIKEIFPEITTFPIISA